jgi:patatin-like phospholipase/acyl hydrolase
MAFKILSLDGGGIRGVFITACLARLERQLNQPLARYFDLIAGTSSGGFIAALLGFGYSAAEVHGFFKGYGARIFERRTRQSPTSALIRKMVNPYLRRIGLELEWLHGSRYKPDTFAWALKELFDDQRLGASKSRLVIPAVNLSSGRVVVFKTPHRPGLVRDRKLLTRDVVLAACAAPTYFPHVALSRGTAYTDGALWANNPCIVAYGEAMRIREHCRRRNIDPPFTEDQLRVLSIGTGKKREFAKPRPSDTGLKWWAPRIVDVMGNAQSEGTNFQMRYLLGPRYTRIDFPIPDATWRLDAVDKVDALEIEGFVKGDEFLSRLRPLFFESIAAPYRPYLG